MWNHLKTGKFSGIFVQGKLPTGDYPHLRRNFLLEIAAGCVFQSKSSNVLYAVYEPIYIKTHNWVMHAKDI